MPLYKWLSPDKVNPCCQKQYRTECNDPSIHSLTPAMLTSWMSVVSQALTRVLLCKWMHISFQVPRGETAGPWSVTFSLAGFEDVVCSQSSNDADDVLMSRLKLTFD